MHLRFYGVLDLVGFLFPLKISANTLGSPKFADNDEAGSGKSVMMYV